MRKWLAALLSTRVNAGILSLVLVIGLVTALLITSLITLAGYYRTLYLSSSGEDRLLQNAQSGIAYLMASESAQDSIATDLYDKGVDSVWLQKKPWGAYNVLLSTARSRKRTISDIVLQGHFPDGSGLAALYLSDENRPLSLSGNSRINGDIFLPKAGVRTSQIEGRSFTGNTLTNGNRGESNSSMLPLNESVFKPCQYVAEQGIPSVYRYIELNTLPDSLHRSFMLPTLLFEDSRDLNIRQNLSGNIILRSLGTLRFAADSHIEDLVAFAKNVIIEEGFRGKVQIFATDTIIIERNCLLAYPSVLAVNTTHEGSLIHIGENARIEGIVLSTGNGNSSDRLINIQRSAKIYGHVYADGLISLTGSVYGHLACRKFVLSTPSAVYENNLLDAEIDSEKLPQAYVGAALWWSSNKKGIVKWLK